MVYVDNMRASFGRMIMCHMAADSHDELVTMAQVIGIADKWIQDEGTWREHYDITLSKRKLAVKWGAKPITQRELLRKVMRPKQDVVSEYMVEDLPTWNLAKLCANVKAAAIEANALPWSENAYWEACDYLTPLVDEKLERYRKGEIFDVFPEDLEDPEED